jgi:hypothetical protein
VIVKLRYIIIRHYYQNSYIVIAKAIFQILILMMIYRYGCESLKYTKRRWSNKEITQFTNKVYRDNMYQDDNRVSAMYTQLRLTTLVLLWGRILIVKLRYIIIRHYYQNSYIVIAKAIFQILILMMSYSQWT